MRNSGLKKKERRRAQNEKAKQYGENKKSVLKAKEESEKGLAGREILLYNENKLYFFLLLVTFISIILAFFYKHRLH